MATRIDTVEARSRLKVRSAPYWQRLTAGRHIGFRRMSSATDGTWLCQSYDPEDSKQTRRSLGDFAHLPPSQRYDAAKAEAELWFKHLDRGGKLSVAITVKTACEIYVEHLRSLGKGKTADDVKRRFAQYVNEKPLGLIELQRLKSRDVEIWRKSLATTMATPQDKSKAPTRPRSASTLNRDMTPLRAALNLALADGHVTTDAAWKAKMRPLKDADRRRDVYLDLAQRRALIAKAPADLAVFLSALSLVPLRPGSMAALVAGSFDKRLSTLTIGKDKHGQDRKITLPPATANFFAEQGKNKLPTAPLLARADGSAWNKDAWKYPIKDAVIAAELPAAATAYALRHSTITDLIALHKLDTLTVAQLSGTSLLMIEKHYGHLLREHAAKALASLTL
jgi:integrase